MHFFSEIFLWYYCSISLLLVTIKNFLRIFRVWLSARPFLWLHWSWQDTSFLFSSPCSGTPSRLQMSARWVLWVFQFDLPFDIRLQINRNWNLAENSVTEIDIYVQHSVRSACKYTEWRREGTLFPETRRRNMWAWKAGLLLGYPTVVNWHLVLPTKLTFFRLTQTVSDSLLAILKIQLFLWKCSCHLRDLNIHLSPKLKKF